MIAAVPHNRRTGSPRSSRLCNSRRSGFTLLELLIASALAATLLVGLWTMFSIYSDLFQTGFTRAEVAQVARALVQQLSDDLHHAIQDPLPGAPQNTSNQTAVRRFGLLGTAESLRIDVLQPSPELPNLQPVNDTEGIVRENTGPRIPELRTVYYEFHDPAAIESEEPTSDSLLTGGVEAEQEEQLRVPGLVRRELDFEVPASEASSQEGSFVGRRDLASNSANFDQQQVPDWIDLAEYFADGTDIWVPEVVGLSLRYFDGQNWSSSWNSLQRKALPAAVEVTLQLVARDDIEAWRRSREQGGLAVESGVAATMPEVPGEAAGAVDTEPEAAGPKVYVFRSVIDVPGSPMHRAPRSASRLAVERPQRRAVQRALSRRTMAPAAPRQEPTQLPDQWMRTNP